MTVDVAPEIVDRVMDVYCDWREQCLKVHAPTSASRSPRPRIATWRVRLTTPRSAPRRRGQ